MHGAWSVKIKLVLIPNILVVIMRLLNVPVKGASDKKSSGTSELRGQCHRTHCARMSTKESYTFIRHYFLSFHVP
jgi:hypothetical protein